MDNRSPRSRGILGPKPTPFKVRGDSNKITKTPQSAPSPPPEPPQIHQQEPSQSRVPPRPVITYIGSPKIITTNRRDYKSLVHRLTGMPSTSTASDAPCGLISPAARNSSTKKNTSNKQRIIDQHNNHHQYYRHPIERQSFDNAGILPSGPTSLPLKSAPDFFSTVGPTEPQGEPLGPPPLPQPPQNHHQEPSRLWPLHRRSEPYRPQPPRNHPQEPSIPWWPLHRRSGPLGPPPLPQPPHSHQQEPSTLWPLPCRSEQLGPPPLPQPPHNYQQEPSISWFDAPCGLISPEAQFDSTEKSNVWNELGAFLGGLGTMDQYHNDQQHQHHANGQPSFHDAGNLSAGPTSMPLRSPDFFPTFGPSELEDFSSFFSDDSNYVLPTSSSTIESPSTIEDFNDFFDS